MTYATQAAGTSHRITAELRVASGDVLGNALTHITFSTASASYPLMNLAAVGAELNPLTTRRTLAGVTAEIADTLDVRRVFAPGYLVQARLVEPVGPLDLTMRIGRGEGAELVAALGAAPYALHVGAETVIVNAVSSPPGQRYDELAIGARGAGTSNWRTDPSGHVSGSLIGAAPQRWVGRLVSEVIVYPNGDEKLVALYACDDMPVFRDGVWALPMQDALGFYNRTIGRGMGTATIANGADYGDASLNRQGILIAGDQFIVEDSIIAGSYHLNPWGFRFDGGLIWAFSRPARALGVLKAGGGAKPDAYFFPWAGLDGPILQGQEPTIGTELEPVVIVKGAAATVVLALLTSIKGDTANGAYDQIPGTSSVQTGAGISLANRINDAAIIRILRNLPTLVFVIEPGELLLDVLERELSYLGLYLDVDDGGLITLRKVLYPTSTQDCDHQLTDSSAHASATDELRMSNRMVSRVTLKSGFDPVEGEHGMILNMPGELTDENALGEEVVFEPTWLPAPANIGDLEVIRENLGRLSTRWGSPHPAFVMEHDWTAHLVKVGDTVAVTNARLPDSNGGLGVVVAALATAVESDLDAGLVRITAEAVGSSRGGYLCPAGEIVNVAALGAGSYALTMQVAGASRLVSGLLEGGAEADEAEYFAIGWAVVGRDEQTGALLWTGTVTAIAGPVLTVTAGFAPVVNQIVSMDDFGTYGPTPAAQPPLDTGRGNARPGLKPGDDVAYLWQADANEQLGAGNEPAKEWV